MKKSLTALAVMAAVSVPFAAAQADATIYGKAHMSVDYVDNKVDGMSGADIVHISTNSTRLGVKGDADLGSGMKAVFKFESDVGPGEGETSIGGRNTYVGLSSGAGTVLLGRHDSPVKGISRKMDFFGDRIGDARNVVKTTATGDARPDEMFVYQTPSIAGADLTLATNLATGTADQAAGLISAALNYKMGKQLHVGAGYQMASADYLGDATLETESIMRAGAKYNMGAISVAALFQMTTNEKGAKDANRMSYGLGAAYKMGKMTIKAQGYMAGDVDGDKSDGTLIAAGVDQKLGDKTTAYAAFAMSMNGDAGKYGVAGGGHDNINKGKEVGSPGAGDGAMAVSLGLIHKF